MNQSQTEYKDQHDDHMAHPMSHEHMHHAESTPESHAVHAMPEPSVGHSAHTGIEKSHTDHTGHEQMFRTRFWICLVLSIPVLVYSPAVQAGLSRSPPSRVCGPRFWRGP